MRNLQQNSEFCFPLTSMFPSASPREKKRVSGKQNSALFPMGSVKSSQRSLEDSPLIVPLFPQEPKGTTTTYMLGQSFALLAFHWRAKLGGVGLLGERQRNVPLGSNANLCLPVFQHRFRASRTMLSFTVPNFAIICHSEAISILPQFPVSCDIQ